MMGHGTNENAFDKLGARRARGGPPKLGSMGLAAGELAPQVARWQVACGSIVAVQLFWGPSGSCTPDGINTVCTPQAHAQTQSVRRQAARHGALCKTRRENWTPLLNLNIDCGQAWHDMA